jgi:bifunctional DNA-binding transcriptional regulator/antitoxin component of YhaV-PrlF toxin-antitoxin module
MELMRVLGTTKVSKGGKVTLIEAVREYIGAQEGDVIVFEDDAEGNVMIRKS